MFLVDFYCIESMLFMVTVTMPLYGAFVVSFVERQHLLTLKAFSLLISLITFFYQFFYGFYLTVYRVNFNLLYIIHGFLIKIYSIH